MRGRVLGGAVTLSIRRSRWETVLLCRKTRVRMKQCRRRIAEMLTPIRKPIQPISHGFCPYNSIRVSKHPDRLYIRMRRGSISLPVSNRPREFRILDFGFFPASVGRTNGFRTRRSQYVQDTTVTVSMGKRYSGELRPDGMPV